MRAVSEALLNDVRDLSRSRTVVLLLDQYERRIDDVQQWLERTLLTRVFRETESFGRLVIVVASNVPAFPMLTKQLGPRGGDLVYAMTPLSAWRDEHIARWIDQHGISVPSAVQFFRGLLDQGYSLHDLGLVKQVIRKDLA